MSINKYNSTTGELTPLSQNRTWVGTKAEMQAEKTAGTLPTDAIIYITDDEENIDYRSEIKDIVNVYGSKNLIPNTRTTILGLQGIDFTVYEDGHVHAQGTATGETGFTWPNYAISSGEYIVSSGYSSGKSSDGKGNVFINGVYSDGTVNVVSIGSSSDPNKKKFSINAATYPKIQVGIYIPNGTTIDGDFYPMLRCSSITDATYVPYAMTNAQLTKATVTTVTLNSTYVATGTVFYIKAGKNVTLSIDGMKVTSSASAATVLGSGLPKPVTKDSYKIRACGWTDRQNIALLEVTPNGNFMLGGTLPSTADAVFGSISYITNE